MKKILALLIIGFALGGCAQLQIAGQALSLAEKSAANPVTKDDLYKVESGALILLTGLQTYKKACIAGAADKNCKVNVAVIQQYTKQMPPYLAQLRSFVKSNDQINASIVYNNLVTLFGNVKTTATQLGVNIGA